MDYFKTISIGDVLVLNYDGHVTISKVTAKLSAEVYVEDLDGQDEGFVHRRRLNEILVDTLRSPVLEVLYG